MRRKKLYLSLIVLTMLTLVAGCGKTNNEKKINNNADSIESTEASNEEEIKEDNETKNVKANDSALYKELFNEMPQFDIDGYIDGMEAYYDEIIATYPEIYDVPESATPNPNIADLLNGNIYEDEYFQYVFSEEQNCFMVRKYIGTETTVVLPKYIEGYEVHSENYSPAGITFDLVIVEGDMSRSNFKFMYNLKCDKLLCLTDGEVVIEQNAFIGSLYAPNATSCDINRTNHMTDMILPKVEEASIALSFGQDGIEKLYLPSAKVLTGGIQTGSIKELCAPKCTESFTFTVQESLETVVFGGEPDNSIEATKYWYCTTLENLYYMEPVTHVGEKAFIGCEALRYFDGSKVISLDNEAFIGCGLEYIYMPNLISTDGEDIFKEMSNLKFADISSLEKVPHSAFMYDSELLLVSAQKAKEIDIGAFYGCNKLTEFLCENLESVTDSSFEGCTSLDIDEDGFPIQ